MPFTFPVEDIVQEVRIKIWEKLIEDYDPEISAPRTFIIAYLPNTYRGVIYHVDSCLKYTGNADAHKTRSRRTQSGKLRKNLIYIDDHGGLFPSKYVGSNSYHLFQENINIFTDGNDIEDKIDWDTIILEMQMVLGKLDFDIFTALLQGYNQSDISYLLDLSPSQVSNQTKIIKTKLKDIIIELDFK